MDEGRVVVTDTIICNIAEKVKRKAIIIPGLLSHMKDELENALEGWEIIVGTIEACEIPDFIKSLDYTKA